MDALSETLRVVQLVGAIFINARFTAPWCYQSPSARSAAPLLEPGAERVVIFHLITEGDCYVEIGKQPAVKLTAGDVVVFPAGDAHRMTSKPGLPPAKGARLDAVLARRPRQLNHGGGGPTTRLVCGYLACDARLAQILLAGLPQLVKVNVRGSSAGVWLESSVRYALAEARSPRPGGAGVLAKLAEVLFIEVLRLYMNEQADADTGWLAGVRDRFEFAPCRSRARLDTGGSRTPGRHIPISTGGALSTTGGQFANSIPHAVADAARIQSLEPQQRFFGQCRGGGGISDGYGLQPGFSPRVR
jgi:hypothetical protein